MKSLNTFQFGSMVYLAIALTGCSPAANEPAAAPEATQAVDTHSEWWCSEHGMPEEVCAQCDTTLVADFKAKNDWCKEHDRPDSQCFVCHPEKATEFAALYEAKYGKQPPKREESEHHENHEHEEHSE